MKPPGGEQHKITRLWEKITKQKGFLPENSVNGIPAQEFMEGWLELPAYACLDHFPRRVAAEVDYLYFEGWEQPMLHGHRLEIQAKFLRILCKMACFFPYSHFLLDGFFFLPGKGKKAVDGEILCTDVFPYLPLDKLWKCVRKMEKIHKEQGRGAVLSRPEVLLLLPQAGGNDIFCFRRYLWYPYRKAGASAGIFRSAPPIHRGRGAVPS